VPIPSPDRLRVAGYVRTSSDEQERAQTHEAQVAWLRAEAERRGWDLHVYVEAGVSGETLAARPRMRELLEAVRASRFEAVAVRSIDRLCRSQGLSDWATIADTFKAAGVVIANQSQDVDLRDPTQALMFTMLGPGIAGYEKSQILARTRAGAERAIRAGRKPRGVDPLGYRHHVRDQRWEIVESEADTVRRAFALAGQGYTTWEIEDRLRAECRWNRQGGAIGRASVHRMLRRRTYRGEWQHKGGTVKLPPIVDEETWQKAQGGKRGPRAPSEKHFLAGLVRCAVCDLPCHVVAVGKGLRHSYVRCASSHPWYQRRGAVSCRGSWRQEAVEEVVWGMVVRLLGDASYLNACRPRRKEDPAVKLRAEIEDATARIAAVEAKIRGATLRWSHGQITDAAYDVATGTLNGELALARDRVARATRDLAALEALRAVSAEAASTLDRYRSRLQAATVAQKRAVLSALCPRPGAHGVLLYPTGRLVLRGIAPEDASKLGRPSSVKGGAARLAVPFAAESVVPRPRRRAV
jgi:DNA invertase Pin-like site-specific DNA recombinase